MEDVLKKWGKMEDDLKKNKKWKTTSNKKKWKTTERDVLGT
jgi:hypothetical protein